MNGVKDAANAGYVLLKAGGSALDAVEAALRSMEDDEYLNAGKKLISTSYDIDRLA